MHVSQKELEDFQNNAAEPNDMIAFLEHLDHCDFCLEQMLHEEEQHSTVTTPAYLKEQILAKAASPEVLISKTASDTSSKMKLFYYSLRTAAGMLAALFLLFSIGQVDFSSLSPPFSVRAEAAAAQTKRIPQRNILYDFSKDIGQGLSDGTSKISDYLNDFFK